MSEDVTFSGEKLTVTDRVYAALDALMEARNQPLTSEHCIDASTALFVGLAGGLLTNSTEGALAGVALSTLFRPVASASGVNLSIAGENVSADHILKTLFRAAKAFATGEPQYLANFKE